jgi:hypothetical protein
LGVGDEFFEIQIGIVLHPHQLGQGIGNGAIAIIDEPGVSHNILHVKGCMERF